MELEEKCLQWLLDNSSEIIDANDKLDEVLADMSAIDAGLHNFADEMTTYMAAVVQVENETTALTREMTRAEELVSRLRSYIDGIILDRATEVGLRDAADPSSSQFWIYMTELANKLESVKRLTAEAMQAEIDRQRRGSFCDERPLIIDSESASISENITNVSKTFFGDILSSEGASQAGSSFPSNLLLPPPPPPRMQSRTCMGRRCTWPSLVDAETALREVEGIARDRIYQHVLKQVQKAFGSRAPLPSARCQFMSQTKRAYDYLHSSGLSRQTQVIRDRYSSLLADVHKQQAHTYFQVIRDQINMAEYTPSDLQRALSALGFTPLTLEFLDRNTPKILTGAADLGASANSSGLLSLIVNTVMPQQHNTVGLAVRRNTIPASQSASGEINSLYGTMQEIKERFLLVEDVFRSTPSLNDYVKSRMRVQPEELLKLTILAVMETGAEELQFIDSYFYNVNTSTEGDKDYESINGVSKSRSERDSISNNSISRGKGPAQICFEKVFSASLNETRAEITRNFINSNCDLVSLIIMKLIITKYLDSWADVDGSFVENMLTNITASINKQFERTLETILMTINHNNKPAPQSNSEMFVRQGHNDGLNRIPSPSTVKILMESFIILALGGESENLNRVQKILQGLHESVELEESEKKLGLCGNVHFIITLLEEADLPEKGEISDLSTWATSYRARLTEAMAVELFNTMRPDLVQTVQAAEAQLKTDGAVGESTRIKLAKFTNTDFSGDLRRLASIFSDRELMFGMTSSQMNELTNDILTKYLVLHTRFRDVLISACVPINNLISSDSLMNELKEIEPRC